MKTFEFQGPMASSKSHLNRALILKSYKPSLFVNGKSQSRDVVHLQNALSSSESVLDVGEGGTTLRFLAFRVSRKPGKWVLKGSRRLFERPQKEILNILEQFGVNTSLQSDSITIESKGWEATSSIEIDLSKSSQFASGVLLNSWELPFDLNLHLSRERVSDGYLEMTLSLLREAGMKILVSSEKIHIPAHQKILTDHVNVEPDVSSAFVVAALAAARGYCNISDFPKNSLQPDRLFLELFKKMNIPHRFENSNLIVERAGDIQPIEVTLKNAPDLFPVLCVLLSKANGTSHIYDTPQLIHKESNRLTKTSELLRLMKIRHEALEDGIKIHGPQLHHHEFFEYDPDEDHRLAFAAAVAKSMGYRMRILHPHVVEKSFPNFWSLIGGGPG